MAKAKRNQRYLLLMMMVLRPGYTQPGEAVKDLGKIIVVAPDKAQSGMGTLLRSVIR
jgi:hypothetical protein